ncbi:MAG: threonine/serine exporter family protein [Clostridia bacterium]|nr:threonine/serine exporter family protein [Clostridia bacterium]
MKELLSCTMDIAEQMLICGAEVCRVEDSVKRMCMAMGAKRVDVFIITSSMIATVYDTEDHPFTQTRRITGIGTDMERLHQLNALSRRICENRMSTAQIKEAFAEVVKTRSYPWWVENLSYAVIAAAFTLFFGGGWIDAAVSFFVGILLKWVVFFSDKTLKNKIFARFFAMYLACALAYGGVKLGWLTDIDKVMIGNIMTLIPGVGLTNALRDLFTGDSIAGLLRLIEAVLTALAIAAGYFLFTCTLGVI